MEGQLCSLLREIVSWKTRSTLSWRKSFGAYDGILFILRTTSQKASREDRSPGYLQNEIWFKCIRCWICIMRRYKDQLDPMVDKRLFVSEFQYCETAWDAQVPATGASEPWFNSRPKTPTYCCW
jgi:hypothetical protein